MALPPVLRVALPVPLRRSFEYLPPRTGPDILPGMRISVPFGRTAHRVGMVLETTDAAEVSAERLKHAGEIIDARPLFDAAHLAFLRWASDYYQHPLGEVIFGALPGPLRAGRQARAKTAMMWRTTGAEPGEKPAVRAGTRQAALLKRLEDHPGGIAEETLLAVPGVKRETLRALEKKGLVACVPLPARIAAQDPGNLVLNAEQAAAVETLGSQMDRFRPFLLNGVTGSGKTEVYINLINRVVERGAQALVLVPEIGLTPQLVERIRNRVAARIAVLHSGMSDGERLEAWLAARDGNIGVLLGTRSAVWTPLRNPGLVVVDEEHDPSYKQQDGFRYSARDVAIVRARDAGVPIVLGSATPSMESLHNVRNGRFTELRLRRRAGSAAAPTVRIIDLRRQPLHGAVSDALMQAIGTELEAKHQVLLFLNRRGWSPVIMCHDCGWSAECRRCDLPMASHRHGARLMCHHCGLQAPLVKTCPQCGAQQLLEIGHGTERLAETLGTRFPGARILRIDRDSTRRRGAMSRMVKSISAGDADILIGTQMLAKGHDFPNLTLVGIVDADRGLFSTDFRMAERMAQLFVQVSGRAGRARHPGTVLIQTHHPDHPLLVSLLRHGYDGFAEATLAERRDTQMPPCSYLALLRAEHYGEDAPRRFLEDARKLLEPAAAGVSVFGPVPAPLERRAGRFRFQLLVQAEKRTVLGKVLAPWTLQLESLPSGRKVRWSLDVDPTEMS